MPQTFSWIATGQPTGDKTFAVLTASFGDGYEQTAPSGINNKRQSWPLTFLEEKSVIEEIEAFLDARQGAEAFFWTPPIGPQILVKAPAYSTTPAGGNMYTLSVTFNQAFQP